MTILQPVGKSPGALPDPRRALPVDVRDVIQWVVHDPTVQAKLGYLASSSNGERIYLSRDVLDADLVLPIFAAGFDSVLGYRSPGGLLYPGLSDPPAFAKARGEGHRELQPENDRPLRQLGEEICWLLGVQFAIGVMPSRIPGQAAAIFAGQWEAVQRETRHMLNRTWTVALDRRAEMVVLSISESPEHATWDHVGAALEFAQKLVIRDGRIVVLSSLSASPGPGMEMLRSSRSARTALQRMRTEAPVDLVPATQVASAVNCAPASLPTPLDASLIEDLQLSPLESPEEARKLIGLGEDVVLIDGSEHMWGEVVAE